MKPKKVFLAGGTGFVGRGVLRELISQEYDVTIIIRNGSKNKIADLIHYAENKNVKITLICDDIKNVGKYAKDIAECHAIINLIGIIKEFARKDITYTNLNIKTVEFLLNLASAAKIKRFIHVSALGVEKNIDLPYFRSKAYAEKLIIESGIDWTIFRPSIIFGEEDKFINLMLKFIFPCFPYIIPGNGENLFQPIALSDLSKAIVSSITMDNTKKVIYDAVGAQILSFNDIVKLLYKAKEIKLFLPLIIPTYILLPVVKLIERLPFFPITTEQLKMLQYDNISDNKEFIAAFDIKPITLSDYLKENARRLGIS